MKRRGVWAVTLGSALVASTLGVGAAGAGADDGPIPPLGAVLDAMTERARCDVGAPESWILPEATDDGSWVDIDVLIPVEGAPIDEAAAIVDAANTAYSRHRMRLVPTYVEAEFTADDLGDLLDEVRRRYGTVPAGFDVVHVMTTEIVSSTGIGLASCIGGVQYPHRAFSVGAITRWASEALGPVVLRDQVDAVTVAHEIGHLLGARHEFSNCAEPLPAVLASPGGACTVMWGSMGNALVMSGLEGEVIRAHALQYAR